MTPTTALRGPTPIAPPSHPRCARTSTASWRRWPREDGCWTPVAGQDVPGTLAFWRRALRPGGVLGLSTAVGRDDEQGWEAVPYAQDVPGYDAPLRRWFVYHSPAHLQSLLTAAGFEIRDLGMRESHRSWLQVIAVAGPAR